jgi:hypothetical protein
MWAEFIRRFLLHVLPKGFHHIRHYDPFAGTAKAETIASARELLLASQPEDLPDDQDVAATAKPRPCCGGRNDRHRDLPSRLPAAACIDRQHRHIMTVASSGRCITHWRRWSSPSCEAARSSVARHSKYRFTHLSAISANTPTIASIIIASPSASPPGKSP